MAVTIPNPAPANRYQLKAEVERQLHDYQWELALPGLSGQNYIICAPTGSGKTRVAGLIISEHLLKAEPHGRVIFMVNKVPLVQQQRLALQDMIHGVKIKEVTGDLAAHKKAMLSVSHSEDSCSSSEEEDGKNNPDIDNDIIVCTAGCLFNQLHFHRMSISDITLLVIDECHNTRKNSDYAKIMEMYIRAKKSSETKLPQVIGLTATPGAGDTSHPTLSKVMDHMATFCAAMDAQGGIKTVTKNRLDLKLHQASAIHTRAILEGRSEDEPFVAIVAELITRLENWWNLKKPTGSKWSLKYIGWVNAQLHECQESGKSRDKIGLFKMLKSLSTVLIVYQNLCYEDAMAELCTLSFPPAEKATAFEKHLSVIISQLIKKLTSLERVENPLLLQMEAIIEGRFSSTPNSKVIVFVETKTEAVSIHRWIESREKLKMITPNVMTGQLKNTAGTCMTKPEQDLVLRGFRGDECNLLVSTSVLEEGLDVPACNLVIRYQKVTSEIAQVQSRGRARAIHSQSVTITSSDSQKHFQELLNEEKNFLVEQALEILPFGENLHCIIQSKQDEILKQSDWRKEEAVKCKNLYSAYEVDLQCCYCSAFLCNGSAVRTIPTTLHYVVIEEDILTNVLIKDHHTPFNCPSGLSRSHKLHCAKCEHQSLGILGRWWKNHVQYPVLKCRYIKFVTKGRVIPCKQWKNVPFAVPPL